jgi:hypothetical protein
MRIYSRLHQGQLCRLDRIRRRQLEHNLACALERENSLNKNGAVAGCGRAERASGQGLRFAEERRTQSAVGRAQVHNVEDVQSSADESQAVLAGDRGIQLRLSLRTTQSTAIYAAISPLHARCAFGTFESGTDTNHFADPHMHHEIRRANSRAIWDDPLSRAYRVDIQTAIGSGNHVRAPTSAISGPRVELVIRGEIVTYHQVIGRSRLSSEQWRNDDSMGRSKCPAGRDGW